MIFIPFCFFLLYFLFEWKHNREIANIGSVITLYYIISSLFAIIIYYSGEYMHVDLTIIPTILYCLLLSITIHPFYRVLFHNKKFVSIEVDNKTFKVVSWILILLCLMFFFYIIKDVVNVLRGDLRMLRYTSMTDDSYQVVKLGGYIQPAYYAIYFSPILLLFFFYSISFMRNSTIFNILLVFSSLVLPIYGITDASRTQVIYWLMTGSVLFAVFYPHMPKKARQITIILISAIIIIAFIYIEVVTISRFGINSRNSLFNYIGQPFLQFNNVYNHYTFDGKITFDRTFPILSSIFGDNAFNVREYRRYQSLRIGAQTGVFLTFLGDAMLDFGKIGMILYAIIIRGIEDIAVKKIGNNDFTLSNLIILTLLFRIPLLGIFADMYLTKPTSVMIISSLVLAYAFSNVKIVIRRL